MVLQYKLLFENEITKQSSVPSSTASFAAGMVTFKSDFLASRTNPGTSVVIVVELISCTDFGIVVPVKF